MDEIRFCCLCGSGGRRLLWMGHECGRDVPACTECSEEVTAATKAAQLASGGTVVWHRGGKMETEGPDAEALAAQLRSFGYEVTVTEGS